MSDITPLFTPIDLGPYTLSNRIVLAPMTRNRAGAGNAPTALNAQYYAQRAGGGLLITEATQISPQGLGYPNTPGIYSPEQIAGWRLVTDAVHARGGRIFAQLWHVGRISHPSLQPEGALPVAPSAIAPDGSAITFTGLQPFVAPRALETHEIPGIVADYRLGARAALDAGFDGVEVHGANGYLLDQFLEDGSNQRTDQYGGPAENRARLLLEATQAAIDVWGADRVGVRLSPGGAFNTMRDSDPGATFTYAAKELRRLGIIYLHLIEPAAAGAFTVDGTPVSATRYLKEVFQGIVITAQGYDRRTGDAVIAAGDADLVAYGQAFLANPDLPARFARNAPLNEPDVATFYGGDARGYTDYPTLTETLAPA